MQFETKSTLGASGRLSSLEGEADMGVEMRIRGVGKYKF